MSTLTFRQESNYYYAVISDGQTVGYAYSHPRCLPRSWSVRLADGTGPYSGTEVREWFKTRKQAGAWLVALQTPCEACGTPAGTPCDPFCIGRAAFMVKP